MRLARFVVRCATLLLPRASRSRHLEEWRADVEGASDLGLAPLPVAMGAVAAAASIAATSAKGSAMLPIGPVALILRFAGAHRQRVVLLAAMFALLLAGGSVLLFLR